LQTGGLLLDSSGLVFCPHCNRLSLLIVAAVCVLFVRTTPARQE
jgi:hypothetical protein